MIFFDQIKYFLINFWIKSFIPPEPGLLSKLQFLLSFLFREYRFDFEAKSINFSWSILYWISFINKSFNNCSLVVSWSNVFYLSSSLLLIISSFDSTNQNSSSFSYFENNLDSEVKELFPYYIFLKFVPQSVIQKTSVPSSLLNSFLWTVDLCDWLLFMFLDSFSR